MKICENCMGGIETKLDKNTTCTESGRCDVCRRINTITILPVGTFHIVREANIRRVIIREDRSIYKEE